MTVTTDPRKTGIAAGMSLLAASAVAASVTGTTSETALATVTIPGGAMGLNGGVEIRSTWSYTNSANNKFLRAKFGGAGGTAFLDATQTATATWGDSRRIRNRNSLASQVGSMSTAGTGGVGSSSAAVVTGAINSAVDQTIVFTAQLALGTETITLESYEVWLLPG